MRAQSVWQRDRPKEDKSDELRMQPLIRSWFRFLYQNRIYFLLSFSKIILAKLYMTARNPKPVGSVQRELTMRDEGHGGWTGTVGKGNA